MRTNLTRAACVVLLGVQLLGAKPSYDVYFIGNSLTRGLTLPDNPSPARLRLLFQAVGYDLNHGTQLAGGVNLEDHWNLSPSNYNFIEVDANTSDPSRSTYKTYPNALQGGLESGGATTYGNYTWDAVVLQPYQSYIDSGSVMGDREAINNFIRYAIGGNPSGTLSSRQFFIYVAWPRLKSTGIEERAVDTDQDGFYTYSEFYEAPYTEALSPAGKTMPSRGYIAQLMQEVPGLASGGLTVDPQRPVRLIPVAEVFRALDALIRSDTTDAHGFAAHLDRKGSYFQTARFNSSSFSHPNQIFYTDPANKASTWATASDPFEFVRAHGIKNIYADNVHMNDVPHGGPDAGTIGAYIAGATVVACITGEHPQAASPGEVASIYEQFDASADATLITTIQDTIWSVLTSADPVLPGQPTWSALTGVRDREPAQQSYEGFRLAAFTPAQQADPQQSGPDVDLDGDGLPNYAEFVLQSNPTDASDSGVFSFNSLPPGGTFTFSMLAQTGLYEVVLETSGNLEDWSPIPINSLPATFSDGMATYSISPAGMDPARFYRLNLRPVPD